MSSVCSSRCLLYCQKCYNPYTCDTCNTYYDLSNNNTQCIENKTTEALHEASGLLVFVIISLVVFGIFCYALRVRKLEGF